MVDPSGGWCLRSRKERNIRFCPRGMVSLLGMGSRQRLLSTSFLRPDHGLWQNSKKSTGGGTSAPGAVGRIRATLFTRRSIKSTAIMASSDDTPLMDKEIWEEEIYTVQLDKPSFVSSEDPEREMKNYLNTRYLRSFLCLFLRLLFLRPFVIFLLVFWDNFSGCNLCATWHKSFLICALLQNLSSTKSPHNSSRRCNIMTFSAAQLMKLSCGNKWPSKAAPSSCTSRTLRRAPPAGMKRL